MTRRPPPPDRKRSLSAGRPAAPTLNDVAKRAGVSAATVSRVLNAPNSVAPAARASVLESIKALAYVRDNAARALASRRTHLVGAIVPALDNPIFARCLETLERSLNEAGFGLLLTTSGNDAARELAGMQMLLERGAEGLMLVGAARAESTYAFLAANDVAYCLTWTSDPDERHPCIGFDNRKAAARVAAYLGDIGHRRFGMIAGYTRDNDRAAARLAGVREELAARGLSLVVSERAYAVSEGRDAVRAMVRGPDRVTAVICGNDILALGAIAESTALGLDVPRDVSITGFDDLDIAACSNPPLTTVRVRADLMGSQAADCLIGRIGGAAALRNVELDADLIVRGSTGPPPQQR